VLIGLLLVLTRVRSLPFILVALLCIPIFGMKRKQVGEAWGEAVKHIKNPLIAMVFAVPMVRIMMQSGNNPNDIVGMLIAMATAMTGIFQYSVAEQLGISTILTVSLQNIGGAMSNMICVHNVIAACATVGLVYTVGTGMM